MKKTSLITSGEFAEMCNISRELLIHYDKIGLLKPQFVKENGYRYYSLKQLYLFDVIRFFSDTGMSMKEIKDYIDNRSTDRFLETIQENIDKMVERRDILTARIGMMEKMRYITERALAFPKDTPRLSYWDEVYLITTPVERNRCKESYAKSLSEHSDYCRNTAHVSRFPLGRILEFPDITKPEEYYYSELTTWIDPPEKTSYLDGRLMVRPRGNYAVILHQGGTKTVYRSYAKLFKFLKQENLEMLSPIYEMDINSYLMSEKTQDYLLHISVLVGD